MLADTRTHTHTPIHTCLKIKIINTVYGEMSTLIVFYREYNLFSHHRTSLGIGGKGFRSRCVMIWFINLDHRSRSLGTNVSICACVYVCFTCNMCASREFPEPLGCSVFLTPRELYISADKLLILDKKWIKVIVKTNQITKAQLESPLLREPSRRAQNSLN